VPSLLVDGAAMQSALEAEVSILDACNLERDSLDVIVCDPPYGFNTTEDREALAMLYSRFFDAALVALREHGHLIVCLPAESYTGRDLPYCTHSKLVSNQILAKAAKLGKHVFAPGRSIPHRMILPPYYWEAERALRRVILHYRISSNGSPDSEAS
jgi:tRNA G10  N-methylase Trm11